MSESTGPSLHLSKHRLPYQYRVPDFRSRTTIFDIKPAGTPLAGPQYIDFMGFSGLSDVRWIYYIPY